MACAAVCSAVLWGMLSPVGIGSDRPSGRLCFLALLHFSAMEQLKRCVSHLAHAGEEGKDGVVSPRNTTAQGLFPWVVEEPHIWKVRATSVSATVGCPVSINCSRMERRSDGHEH